MAVETKLDKAVELGTGKTFKPPAGWVATGFVSDNYLWLKPKNRMSWHPPGTENTSLIWELNAVPLPPEVMAYLIALLRSQNEQIIIEQLQPLYPTLIRMPLNSIAIAKILSFPEGGRLLAITYSMPESDEFGIVHYVPTELSDLGEFEKLSYEGKQPDYSNHLDLARLALSTFATKQYSQDDEPPVYAKARKTKQTTTLAKAAPAAGVQALGTQNANAADTNPAAITSAGNIATPPNTTSQPTASPSNKISSQAPNSQAKKRTTANRKAAAAGSALPKNRRLTAELSALTTVAHILEPGETILGIVHKRWPGLDEKNAQIKMREIYVINRILKNQVEAWNLKPGMTVFLPQE